jgi:hypothetical protein
MEEGSKVAPVQPAAPTQPVAADLTSADNAVGNNRSRMIIIGLRILAAVLALIAFLVMVTDDDNYQTFSDYNAYSFLVASTLIQFVFTLIIVVWDLVGNRFNVGSPKMMSAIFFFLDFVIIWLSFAGFVSAASIADILNCDNDFCGQAIAAIVIACLAWLAELPCFLLATGVFYRNILNL